MTKINTIIGAISVAFGLLIIYLSRDMSMFDEYGVPGERFWPYGLAILFILLGIFQWIGVVVDKIKHVHQSVDLSSTAVKRAYGLGIFYAAICNRFISIWLYCSIIASYPNHYVVDE